MVVVVVLRPIAAGHGLLRLGASVASTAIHGAVGKKDDAAVLLGLVADVEILNDLPVRLQGEHQEAKDHRCGDLQQNLISNETAWVFRSPWHALQVRAYFTTWRDEEGSVLGDADEVDFAGQL